TPTTLGCRQRSAPRNPYNLGLPSAVSAPEPPAGGCRGGPRPPGPGLSPSGGDPPPPPPPSPAPLGGWLWARAAAALSILLPVLFLVLFGALYRDSGAPKLTVVEIGDVSLLSHAGGQPGLSGILTVSRTGDKKAAVREVRRGDADAAVEQAGRLLIVHYSIADPTTAAI